MKAVYSTGDVARICNISQQTVIRCFDSGRLRGFRVPGSKFRRIPRKQLLSFMKDNEIPIARLDSGKSRVLVVDDDKETVNMLTDLLDQDGRFVVKSSSTGFDAGMMTREFLPDLLLLDFKLPDVNGNIVCRRIREDHELRHTKIIIISGVADPDEIKELRQAGADDFIKKPFDVSNLIKRMVELIGT